MLEKHSLVNYLDNNDSFTRVEERSFKGSFKKPENIMVQGENLDILKGISKYSDKGFVDLIYIDPPYNTRSKSFHYKDDRDDWVEFMYERLSIIPEILSDRWLLAVSIDDKELYRVKPMLDEVLGDEYFKSNIAVITSNGANGLKSTHADKTIIKTKEYLLIYSNVKDYEPLHKPKKYLFDSHYNKYYNENEGVIKPLMDVIREDGLFKSKNYNELNIELSNKDSWNKFIMLYGKYIYSDSPFKTDEKFEGVRRIKGHIVYKTKTGSIRKLNSFYESLNYVDSYGGGLYSSVIKGDVWNYTDDMANIGKEGGISFKNGKKPLRLIKNIMKLFNNKNAVVLDFFAGSGTTAEAVLKLNEEDGGNRSFIIATNNEKDKDSGFGMADTITYKRLLNVKNGYGKEKPINYNLNYYKVLE